MSTAYLLHFIPDKINVLGYISFILLVLLLV